MTRKQLQEIQNRNDTVQWFYEAQTNFMLLIMFVVAVIAYIMER